MTTKNWNQEECELLAAMCDAEYTNAEMAAELGRNIDSVASKKSRLGLRTEFSNGGRPKEYTKEQLIAIMQSAPVICYNYFNSKESGLPAATTYREYFGSWEAALKAAGIEPKRARTSRPKEYTREQLIEILQNAPKHTYDYFSDTKNLPSAMAYVRAFGNWTKALEAAGLGLNRSTMKESVPTTLYIVEFDEFYKIGITQQTVDQRLGGRYPKYKVLVEKVFGNLSLAKAEEKRLLQLVKPYKYTPTDFPVEGRGFTECFKVSRSWLEELFVGMR